MKKCLILVLLFGIASILLTACSGTKVRITESDNGQTIDLKQGDTLSLSIDGNPTTGYQWEVEEVDSSILALKGDPKFISSSSSVGAGGNYIFNFTATAPGTTNLKLIYYRSFEKDIPPIDTFVVTVTVQ